MTNFHGVVPPVVTPLTENFEVDYPSYTKVLEHLIAAACTASSCSARRAR